MQFEPRRIVPANANCEVTPSAFQQAVAKLDQRFDAGEAVGELDVWGLLQFCGRDLVRIELSRLLARARAPLATR
jgi:hypothetical protein